MERISFNNIGLIGITVFIALFLISATGFTKNTDQLKSYKMAIASSLSKYWKPNDTLKDVDLSLKTSVFIKILKDGKVGDVYFKNRSENRDLDEAAMKTIMKAIPFPALPESMDDYEVVIWFSSSGLN